MDIVPTNTVFTELSASLAFSYYHWFFLSQPFPVPEKLIERDLINFIIAVSKDGVPLALMLFKNQLNAYQKSWKNKSCIRAMCDDYRAAYHIDQHHEAADGNSQLKYHLPLYGGGMGLWQKRLIWTLFGKKGGFIQG